MIAFRNADEAELAEVLDWAAAEGWNPGLDDAPAFFSADPGGFFVATRENAPIAAISVVNHTPTFAFLGLYLVRPEHRGNGTGHALWQHAIAHAGERTIGLDGVPEQQANYAASGFEHAGGTTRFAGPVTAEGSPTIREANAADIPALIDQEAKASGIRKPAYLSAWFTNAATRRTLIDPEGICTVRQCREGAKIGPLIAGTPDAARRLIHHAASLFDGDLIIDVPETSTDLARLCEDLALTPGFDTARMYQGAAPTQTHRLFAVTSLELG